MALVEIRDVYKSFQRDTQKIDVFTALTLDIEAGSFTALMGPSGSGKSTLLNLIAGLDKPTRGTVRVGGAEVSAMSAGQLAAWRSRHVGFVFQSFNLLPVLTAYQNVELPLLLTRLSGRERNERVKIALDLVGLADRADHYPRQLSGGQEQRAGPAGRQELAGSPDAAAAAEQRVQQDDHHRHARRACRRARQDGPAPREGRPDREAARGGGRPVKYVQLVLANLGRHKLRSILTIASVALALFLFASLRSVTTTMAAAAQFGGARRLVTLNATGLVFPLPLAYGNRIKAMPGVTGLSWANWFGGRYGDGKNFFANFAVDAESYLHLYPEIVMPADQKQAFLQDRTGAIIGDRLISQFGWKLGQNVTLQGTIFQGDWTFKIDGVYHPTDPAIGDNVLIFHHDYFDERIGRAGIAGWYIVEIDDPAHAPTIAKAIDDLFRNSSSPTKTGTEREFQASFATMWGNVSFLMSTIGLAVVFAILLITANAMMMSARERTGEIAVLKTVGFSDRLLFTLVMVEAGALALTGAAIGLGGATLLYPAINFNGAGFLPGFKVATSTLIIGALVAVGLMLASGLVPAVRAARLPIVQALRKVE